MQILTTLVEFFLVYLLVKFVISFGETYLQQKADRDLKILAKLDHITHRVKVEKHGQYFYWFDSDDDEFLAQGKTAEEVIANLRIRFPDHLFFLPDQKIVRGPDWSIKNYDLGSIKVDVNTN
tara:strand:+ start:2070 stop:2435 length:366 start_codon:yes stop_codon:yes gene_type:complete